MATLGLVLNEVTNWEDWRLYQAESIGEINNGMMTNGVDPATGVRIARTIFAGANLNDTINTGVYVVEAGTTNGPSANAGTMSVISARIAGGDFLVTHTFIDSADGASSTRASVDNGFTWTAWA